MAKAPIRARKRVRKQVSDGVAHIHASFNNTIVTITDLFAFLGRHPLPSLMLAGVTAALIVTEVRRLTSGFRRVGPAQVTALMNRDDALVIDIAGEASIQMNIQELSTCLQYKTPVKILSLNNRYLGMVRQWQQLDYGGRYSHSYMDALPDFVKLAEAYGHVGIKIEKPSEVEPALKELIRLKDRTVFLDVRTDPTENVWPMVKAGKGISEMLLGSEDL